MNRLIFTVILIVLFAYPNIMQAEPSNTVQYLFNESVSMFEWGIYKFEQSLCDVIFDINPFASNAIGESRWVT